MTTSTLNCCQMIPNPLVTSLTKIEAENLMITLNLNAAFINYHDPSNKEKEQEKKESTPYPYTHPIREIPAYSRVPKKKDA